MGSSSFILTTHAHNGQRLGLKSSRSLRLHLRLLCRLSCNTNQRSLLGLVQSFPIGISFTRIPAGKDESCRHLVVYAVLTRNTSVRLHNCRGQLERLLRSRGTHGLDCKQQCRAGSNTRQRLGRLTDAKVRGFMVTKNQQRSLCSAPARASVAQAAHTSILGTLPSCRLGRLS